MSLALEAGRLAALPAPGAGRPLVLVARQKDVLAGLDPERLALPPDETARIARFHRSEDRAARTAAHALLRAALAPLLDAAPKDIALVRDRLGRPALPPGREPIDVNLSHGGGWVAVGVARRGRIGVDVEDGASVSDWDRIAPIYLHPRERAALAGRGGRLDPVAALRRWALKEACLKASGEGFSTPPETLDLGPEPVRLRHAGHALAAEACPLPGGAWIAAATDGVSASWRAVLLAR